MIRDAVRGGASVVLVLTIMVLGSFGMWVGTPLLWLWIGSQVQGKTDSIGTAFAVMLFGAIGTIALVAIVLSRLSNIYRSLCVMRGRGDPGHVVLESVLVVSAAITMVCFGIWFFLFAGASPLPGVQFSV